MQIHWINRFKFRAQVFSRFAWLKKGLWLRAVLCWIIGMAFVVADREFEYDLRFQIRGPQPHSEDIILINIDSEELRDNSRQSIETLGNLGELQSTSDKISLNSAGWAQMIRVVLGENPSIIGVSPYLGETIDITRLTLREIETFRNSKIIWSTPRDSDGTFRPSQIIFRRKNNSGMNHISPDRDGVVRRFGDPNGTTTLFATLLALKGTSYNHSLLSSISRSSDVINFRGAAGTFSQISSRDVLNRRFKRNLFKDKIVIIGVGTANAISFRTPVGEMSRAEINANIVDNIQNNRWISRIDLFYSTFLILFFVLLVAWLTSNYPQFLAFFFTVMFNIFYATLSLWIFDSFNFWFPLMAPIIVSSVTYLIFLSFQLTLKDYLNEQLENEHKFMYELEQLKNNFLSLISHDLKTPIAKIQGICDRLLSKYDDEELTSDLSSLRDVASELHRYIRTILQITRVESRDFRLSKDATDINEIILAVVAQLDQLAKQKKIKITTSLEPMFLIDIDHILMHEVILNIVENAIKYTPENGEVIVSSQEVDDRVIVMVQDSGPGIPDLEKKRIFEKFYRGELGKSQPKGSGLGLYLVKYFVELHGGRVLLDSSPKHGTKLGFSLPIDENSNDGDFNLAT